MNSEGYSRFYKGIENTLKEASERMVAIAKEGGLTAADLNEKQKAKFTRTVFDVCDMQVGPSTLTLTDRPSNVDFAAMLKGLWSK